MNNGRDAQLLLPRPTKKQEEVGGRKDPAASSSQTQKGIHRCYGRLLPEKLEGNVWRITSPKIKRPAEKSNNTR